MAEKCENCKYWREFGTADFEKGTVNAGQCQKYPPKLNGINNFETMLKYRFPISAFDDWCGEYEVNDKSFRDERPEIKRQEKHLESDILYDSTKTLADVEKETIEGALHFTKRNREKATKLLGIGLRTLYRKIKEYGLE